MNNRYRPKYHFTAPAYWINDPNGLVQWKDQYHLYYQHHPDGAFWDDMHWGHAVSTDLVNWTHLPIAIDPDQTYDQSGVYSGIALKTEDEVRFYYTGVNGDDQLPCLALASDDLLLRPAKVNDNPLFYPPEDLDLVIFRDHAIVHKDNIWFQVIGSGIVGEGGNCMLYRSDDLDSWEFMHPLVEAQHLASEDPAVTGWECPDFFALGDTYVLVVSHWDNQAIRVWAYTGTFDGKHFVPTNGSAIDLGSTAYAPQSFTDDLGRRVQFNWLRENRPVPLHTADGWAGAVSLPRELFIKDDGTLGMKPVEEVTSSLKFKKITPDIGPDGWSEVQVDGIDSTACVLRFSAEQGLEDFDLELLRSPNGEEVTSVTLKDGGLTVDTTQASTHEEIPGERFTAQIESSVEVLIFVDKSVVEIYLAGQGHTVRAYPERDDATGIRIRMNDGTILESSTFEVTFAHSEAAD